MVFQLPQIIDGKQNISYQPHYNFLFTGAKKSLDLGNATQVFTWKRLPSWCVPPVGTSDKRERGGGGGGGIESVFVQHFWSSPTSFTQDDCWQVHKGCFLLYHKDSRNFGRNSNGKVFFDFFGPEYSGSPWWWSTWTSRKILTEIHRSIVNKPVLCSNCKIQKRNKKS